MKRLALNAARTCSPFTSLQKPVCPDKNCGMSEEGAVARTTAIYTIQYGMSRKKVC
jgi:hypothetical protein